MVDMDNMPVNRIQAAISRYEEKMPTIAKEKLDKLSEQLKTEWGDLCTYQTLQSQAFAMGKLTLAEAQQIYQILGGECPSPEGWDKRPLAERVVVTQIMSELLDAKIAKARR